MKARHFVLIILATVLGLGFSTQAFAQMTLPNINLGLKSTDNPTEIVSTIKILIALTILTLAPAILIMMTSFTRIIIVCHSFDMHWGHNKCPPINFWLVWHFLSLYL